MNQPANTTVFISLFHDTRRAKANGLYPVKLRVFFKPSRKQKLYATKFELSKKDYHGAWKSQKPRQEFKELRRNLGALQSHAETVANGMTPFSFEKFEKKLFVQVGEGQNAFYHYERIIQRFRSNYRFGTASNYEMSRNSLKSYVLEKSGKELSKLSLLEISPTWLERYEHFMLHTKKRSRTTVSMYLRALRTVFNQALSEREIEIEAYPFYLEKGNKQGYRIPAVSGTKRALKPEYLSALFNATPSTPEQEKARDYWFFSYACSGMNIKDIAQLRYKDIEGDQLKFYRAKTINTNRENLRPTVIYLNEYANSIIKKYGNPDKKPGNYVFPILMEGLTEYKKHTSIKNFTRFVNQHLKLLASSIGITGDISTYWARHSFATVSIQKGASMEFVGELLSHRSPETIKNYFAGFEDDTKKTFSQEIMNFHSIKNGALKQINKATRKKSKV